MIIPVSKDTEKTWAQLCILLWPNNTIDSIISERIGSEFIYLIEDLPVAFINLSLRHDYVEGTDSSPVGYIEGIYVKPNFRHKGIAGKLVEHAKKWAELNGCDQLASDCELKNETSRIFHNKIGFKEANIIVCFTMQVRNNGSL